VEEQATTTVSETPPVEASTVTEQADGQQSSDAVQEQVSPIETTAGGTTGRTEDKLPAETEQSEQPDGYFVQNEKVNITPIRSAQVAKAD
jgi:hypothetical protein